MMSLTDMLSPGRLAARSPVISKINGFLTMPQYIIAVMGLALLSNLFGLELPVYTVFAVLTVYICLFGNDLLPLIPVFLCCYIAPSVYNNPGRNDTTVFSGASGIYIGVLGAVIAAACIYRVIRDRKLFFRHTYRLLSGMLLLWAAYLLGGIGSGDQIADVGKNLLFSLLQGASICLPYLLFSGGVDWRKARKDYFAWIGFCMGAALLCQILWIYLTADVVVNGVIHREQIYTGWGIHNNIGGMLAMMIPFAFYLATKYRKGWIGTVVGSLFLLGVLLSCSRNAMLTGLAIYFIGIVLMLYYASNRKGNTIAALICISIAAIAVILFNQQILRLFSDILALGFDPNSRDSIYAQGILLFQKYPLFGGSFFSSEYVPWSWATNEGFTSFFPGRWHNTFVQILASCGVVGMAAYLIHRLQTLLLVIRDHNKEKFFIGCAILALLICSLFDCHFFNIGPTLFYSAALAFAENTSHKN